ncbi:polyisoprenoid-binding protein [Paracidovorax avenae]|uniref:YceI family protein n=1 Tax=Paracidovorax avenae (strain ATCC 19860 / DSM 7227 / CCUG 15838 / JCM 20985 / LMG 2117 / NCPPB 1011) TaxID=643561 RepID=F0QA30_PARA1|nr:MULTISPECIES: YceI family protein [Comamonadaceae]ADX47290.1 YceI family protein [Paracidovorax avenae ATCC 19860]AVS66494.1 polyisoprenoid-binding protein [Paracidovorax avenae]AVS85718.1 polyisoprenoid-binding protein [Paracidovorax avenae]AVS89281.1 polyisoprenoid-binding protein [Paracidovorax avenae]AVS94032.1 polyisoprenoid-binding protein [Paracidovorax avenae]
MRKSLFALAAAAALVAGAAQAETATYTVEPTHTFATFEISHFGASVNRGRFDKKEGTIELDKAAKTGKVDITFQINSINTGTPPFDKHLQSPDIFDAAKYPTARFVGDKFTFDGDKLVSVAGNLTLKGQTHPATFKANQFACYQSPMLKREVCGGDFETTIDRTLFGLDYGVQYGFPKNVRIVAQVEAVKQ